MNVHVMSRFEAIEFNKISFKNPYVIISINDTNQSNPDFRFGKSGLVSVSYHYFDDVEIGEKNCITKLEARQIADFVTLNIPIGVEDIVVHCEGGISRSAGCAAALMKYFNNDDPPIFNNPKYTPNMTVYRFVLEALMNIDMGDEEQKEITIKFKKNKDIYKHYFDLHNS